ncbi:MAG: methyltransferase domain-containing protein [Planctomycetota bacterium]
MTTLRIPQAPMLRSPDLQPRLDGLRTERDWLVGQVDRLRAQLLLHAAQQCAARGHRTIALYPGGRHSRAITHWPWRTQGIAVGAILDDEPRIETLSGIPVLTPEACPDTIEAIVISSDVHEHELAARAEELFELPIIRIYGAIEGAEPVAESRWMLAATWCADQSVLALGGDVTAEALLREGGARAVTLRWRDHDLTDAPDDSFDLLLALQDEVRRDALDDLLADACRVLREGGTCCIAVAAADAASASCVIDEHFARVDRFAQRSGGFGTAGALPPGIFVPNEDAAPHATVIFHASIMRRRAHRDAHGGVTWSDQDVSRAEWERVHQPFELNFHQGPGQWRWTEKWDRDQQAMFGERWGLDRHAYRDRWVLDVGAGPRLRTEWFIEANLVGIEPLAREFGEINHGAYDHPDVCGVHASPAETFIPELEDRFDLAVCHNVLDHCFRWGDVIEHVGRYMRAGGMFILSTDVGEAPAEGHPGIADEASLLQVLEDAGFDVERTIRQQPDSPEWERTLTLFLRRR